jgi:putative heme-binding domain-containing protein
VKIALVVIACLSTFTARAADSDRGQKLYENHCSLCHGETGTGGKGPSLARPVLPRARTIEALAQVIREGLPGTEMPGAWQMTNGEAMQVAQYVRSLGRTAVVKLPGDPELGRAVYDSKGCGSCHIVRGEGKSFGPELTDVGARRSAEYLREAIVKPGATVPEGFLVVRVTTRDGKVIRGMRVNEDTFTIQIRDASGYHSFRKSAVLRIEKQFNQSLMPAYDSLTPAELDNLIAYLASLRGES